MFRLFTLTILFCIPCATLVLAKAVPEPIIEVEPKLTTQLEAKPDTLSESVKEPDHEAAPGHYNEVFDYSHGPIYGPGYGYGYGLPFSGGFGGFRRFGGFGGFGGFGRFGGYRPFFGYPSFPNFFDDDIDDDGFPEFPPFGLPF